MIGDSADRANAFATLEDDEREYVERFADDLDRVIQDGVARAPTLDVPWIRTQLQEAANTLLSQKRPRLTGVTPGWLPVSIVGALVLVDLIFFHTTLSIFLDLIALSLTFAISKHLRTKRRERELSRVALEQVFRSIPLTRAAGWLRQHPIYPSVLAQADQTSMSGSRLLSPPIHLPAAALMQEELSRDLWVAIPETERLLRSRTPWELGFAPPVPRDVEVYALFAYVEFDILRAYRTRILARALRAPEDELTQLTDNVIAQLDRALAQADMRLNWLAPGRTR